MTAPDQINSSEYWDYRFGTGDWSVKGGESQTRNFAISQLSRLRLPRNFDGLICDFGCGAGDALQIYHDEFPAARLVGVDFSASAIALCRQKYHAIAEFIVGTEDVVPQCDVIIVSNVLEHLENDTAVVQTLLEKTRTLYVMVPYREKVLCEEHIRRYDEKSFAGLPVRRTEVFAVPGWSEHGWERVSIHIKNMLRPLLGRPTRRRNLQIIYELAGSLTAGRPDEPAHG